MHDRPTAAELIAAVREHLEREVLPSLAEPRLRFRTLVAVHVLGIVERELGRGDAPLRDEWRRLQALLGRRDLRPDGADALAEALRRLNQELCARIRAGEADAGPFIDTLLDHLRGTLSEKLCVANPEFLGHSSR